MSLQIGATLGAYRLVEQLGQGGMATVYKAHHAALDRYVAIKVMHAAFQADPNFHARFLREARVVARLDHPHIVPIYDYAEHAGSPYLVMKFIEGETLKARLLRGPVTALDVLRYVEALGSALDYAHRQGILHRDIKPSNVMLAKDGSIFLADFGLARLALAGESTLSADSMLGTPQYMSPEQAKGLKELDAGTDLYSLGVVIYELLVGRAPYQADTPFAVIHDHIYTPLPAPRSINPGVPEAIEAVLHKALAKERADRYASAQDLVAAFRAALTPALEAPIIAPARVAPADPTAVTPAAPTVVRPAPPAAPETYNPLSPAPPPAAAVPAAPARRAARPAWWQILAGAALVLVLCLAATALVRRGAQQRGPGPVPTTGSATAASQPTAAATVAATGAPVVDTTASPDAASLFAQAERALADGQLDLALSFLDAAVALDPSDTRLLVRAGDLLLAHGHTLGALETYYGPAGALERDSPTDALGVLQSHVSLAFYVLAADESAGVFLSQQVSDYPEHSLPALAQYRYRLFFDDGAGVFEGLAPLLAEKPNHEGALLIMADYHLSRGQEALATRFYQRVRDLPDAPGRLASGWPELEARCNLEKLRRLRSAATLEATCEDLSLLLTGK